MAVPAVALLALAACDSSLFFAEPAPGPSTLVIRLLPFESPAAAPGPAATDHEPARTSHGPGRAFDQVDQIRVRLEGEAVDLLDEVFPVEGEEGEIRLTVSVDLDEATVSALLELELRVGSAPLFRGGTEITLRRSGRTEADVSLEAVAAALDLPESPDPLEALGDSFELSGAALFATGDTIPEAPITWRSLDPEVVEVTEAGTAVALAEGEARLEAAFQTLSEVVPVVVRQVVETVAVFPAGIELAPGETRQLEVEPRDRRENLVGGRGVAWSSSDPDVASVSGDGLTQGLSPGSAEIEAEVEGVTGRLVVTVAPAPPAVQTLSPDQIERGQARLRAEVNPRGVPVTVRFQWSPDPDLAEPFESGPISVAAGIGPVVVTHTVSGLQPGTTYYARARASGSSGATTGNVVEFETLPGPAPPENLSVEWEWIPEFELSALLVEWDYSFEEESEARFEIERGVVVEGEPPTAWIPIGSTFDLQILDDDVADGTRYAYRVRTCDVEDFCGEFSETESNWVGFPFLAQDLTVFWNDELQGIQVEWSYPFAEPDDHEFELERALVVEGALGTWEPIATTAAETTSYLDDDEALVEGNRYAYRMSTCRPAACNGPTAFSSTFAGAPPVPTDLSAVWNFDTEGFDVEWFFPEEDLGDVDFELERALSEDGEEPPAGSEAWTPVATVTDPEYFDDDGSIQTGERYAYRVRACQDSVCSEFSEVVVSLAGTEPIFTPPPAGSAPQAPQGSTLLGASGIGPLSAPR